MNDRVTVEHIQAHYDRLAFFYGLLWGEPIHHGYWEDEEPESLAHVRLIERLAERADPSIRWFVESFTTVEATFLQGTMIYAMIVGQKCPGR